MPHARQAISFLHTTKLDNRKLCVIQWNRFYGLREGQQKIATLLESLVKLNILTECAWSEEKDDSGYNNKSNLGNVFCFLVSLEDEQSVKEQFDFIQ